MSITHNKQFDTFMLDEYKDPIIMGNRILDNLANLQKEENTIIVPCPDKYKFRPERLAYEYYGNDNFFPIILAVNNISSVLKFIPSEFNNQIKLVKSERLEQLFKL
jgi:hypothetical protein